MTLYINACVRRNSRTNELASFVLSKSGGADIQEVNLQKERIMPLDQETLSHRDECAASGNFSDEVFSYARQFAQADQIVIAAPYWDLLFPTSLRAYFERVCAVGVTSTENFCIISLCSKLHQIFLRSHKQSSLFLAHQLQSHKLTAFQVAT